MPDRMSDPAASIEMHWQPGESVWRRLTGRARGECVIAVEREGLDFIKWACDLAAERGEAKLTMNNGNRLIVRRLGA